MGKIIVSWSPINGQGATTSNIAALASHFALTNEFHSLVTHTNLNFSSLEQLFGKVQSKSKGFEDTGLAALERLVKSNLIKTEAVTDYTETIFAGNLDLLGGFQNEREKSENLVETLLDILHPAYDVIWIDAHSGNDSETTKKILAKADLILINLPQNRFVLDKFYSGEDYPSELNGKNCIVLLSQYNEDQQFSLRKIKRKYKILDPVFPIPYTSQFRDASNNLNIPDYFYKQVFSENKASTSYDFIQSLGKTNKYIIKKLGLQGREAEEWPLHLTH